MATANSVDRSTNPIWMYLNQSNQWHEFDSVSSDKIEDALLAGSREVSITAMDRKSYIVDVCMGNMTQTGDNLRQKIMIKRMSNNTTSETIW